MELSDECRDCAKDSTDPEITKRRYRCINPEWFAPNIRLRLPCFLPRGFFLITHDVEVNMLFQTQTDKIEVFTFVKRLFQEHNALIRGSRSRALFIETAYLFCMDVAESAISSNFFMYIPKSHYRRYLEDVPILMKAKVCIIIDYHRSLAYRIFIEIVDFNHAFASASSRMSPTPRQSTRNSQVESTMDRPTVRFHRNRAAVEFPGGPAPSLTLSPQTGPSSPKGTRTRCGTRDSDQSVWVHLSMTSKAILTVY
uniref:SPATA6 domain-containing protein n=1 Tax=Macrostomum lignano TaxID=282301 RepID=A0A1I8FTA8_9PLAT